MRKRVSILGSTGSIGKSALSIIKSLGDEYEIAGLTANQNLSLFKKQLEFWKPPAAAVHDESTYKKLKPRINLKTTKLFQGIEGIKEIAASPSSDIIICAISGSAALIPLREAIRAKKLIGLASKEPVVMTGELLIEEAEKSGAVIIPVDSEPNAIFQCIKNNGGKEEIKNLIITASGGPFKKLGHKALEEATPEGALSHPMWKMGRKISIDSATMINKGLEVIEAHNLFRIPYKNIKTVIHPEAKIHSLVEFIDGNIMSVMSRTDMRIPIQYAVTYPARSPSPLKPLDLAETGTLSFAAPDLKKFPGLACCYEAGKEGGVMPAVLNAANEVAVESFLGKKIKFTQIPVICKKTMDSFKPEKITGIEQILDINWRAGETAKEYIKKWR